MNSPAATSINQDAFTPVNTQTWVNGRHQMRCVKVIEETWDVKTFCFMAEQPLMFFFKPGQFVTLELEIDGEQVMRSYTISSSPSVPYSFSLTIKRLPGGLVSNWMHDNMKSGDELVVHGPVGRFNVIDYPSEKVMLLSGGVGVTPLMSMARWLFDTNADVDIVFAHSCRTPRDVIYKRELQHMDSRIENFHLHLISEQVGVGQSWYGYRGFLDATRLELMADDFMEREIFCCGPNAYMAAVRDILVAAGFDMSRYHEESFGETPAAVEEQAIEQAELAVEDAEAVDTAEMRAVEFSSSGKSVRVAPEETIHAAASKLGIHIPKACGMGICGTCRVQVISGDAVMEHNGGITDDEIAEGYVLSCCSVPASDLVVDY
ncbi:FAD-binding oxidoreductase [Litorivicinus lipolyticus]|uniref:FAD-binding oxidoreductase n=1 Tax=Litorivicinus lipolyticus TaxID=418701 RepID=UPI003B5A5708